MWRDYGNHAEIFRCTIEPMPPMQRESVKDHIELHVSFERFGLVCDGLQKEGFYVERKDPGGQKDRSAQNRDKKRRFR